MDTKRLQSPDCVQEEKKPYEAPELTELGDVADLTHAISVIVQ